MTRAITFGMMLIAAAFLTRGAVGTADATPNHQQEMREKQCRYQWMDPGTWTAREEARTTACVLERWPVQLSTFDRIISCESGWNRLAYNSAGPYVGLGQVSEWSARFRTFKMDGWDLSPRWKNSRSMLTVVARWMHASGTSAWSCA